jgi:uncharacterized membrane protein
MSKPAERGIAILGETEPDTVMRGPSLAAGLGTGAVALLMIVLVSMHLVQPQLGVVGHFVSEYAYGRLGWLVPWSYVLAGCGTLLMVWPLMAQMGREGWALASAGCLTVIGLGLIGTGSTRIDLAGAGGVLVPTSSGQLHELAGYVAIVGLVAGSFVIPAAFRRDPQMANGTSTLEMFKWGLLAGLIGVLLARQLGSIGLGQRVFLAAALSWLVVVGVQLAGVGSEATQAVLREMDARSRRKRSRRP